MGKLAPVKLPLRLARCLLYALALLVCTWPAVAADRAEALETGLVTDLSWFPGEETNAHTATMLTDSGSRWVRISVGWHDFEPAKGTYNSWAIGAYRAEIARARQAGQRVLLMIHETPAWASGSTERMAPPRDPQDFAGFAAYLATLYGADVDAYEVWNEPNYARFWYPAPDAAAYTGLLRAAYPAIKLADPTARVVFAGPSTNDYAFVEAAYAAGAKGYFDVMGAHPYSCYDPATIVRDPNGRINRGSFLGYREIRSSMLARGDDKPMWFTEFGWSTTSQSCGVSESTQAAYLQSAYALAATDPYVGVAMWYALRNWSPGGEADHVEAQYGLLRSDFTAKPAYAAFKSAAQAPPPAPVPAPRNVAPTSYALMAGTVYSGRGAVSSMATDDGTRVEISSAQIGMHVAEIRATARITAAERLALRTLTFDFDGSTTAATALLSLRVYNAKSSTWETVLAPLGNVVVDRLFSWQPAANPLDYVTTGGDVRFSVRATGPSAFRLNTDLVRFRLGF